MALPRPANAPYSAPQVTLTVNQDWLPVLIGALEALTFQSAWDVSDADWENYFHQWVEDFIAEIAEP